jgi:hypothetical protein
VCIGANARLCARVHIIRHACALDDVVGAVLLRERRHKLRNLWHVTQYGYQEDYVNNGKKNHDPDAHFISSKMSLTGISEVPLTRL